MCGFLGYVGRDARNHAPNLERGLNSLAHRGPDGAGTHVEDWAWVGHRRLAIIDLSSAGLQPFWGRGRNTLLLYNGEIFNYKELAVQLRAEGIEPQSTGDTAVLMAALDSWGIERTLPKLNGFWSLAYINLAKRKVTLSRDRFGVKPLYWARPAADSICFASEPKAIATAFRQFARENEDVVRRFVSNGSFFYNGQSFLAGISVFPPATTATYSLGDTQPQLRRYWDYPSRQTEPSDPSTFRDLFEDAVKLRYRSDVPVGVTVSGGVDSTAVLLATEKNKFPGLNAYTSVFDVGNTSEHLRAQRVCELTGVTLHKVPAGEREWIRDLSAICAKLDSPTASPAVLPLNAICRQARSDGVIVLLEGQGADEAFGGYVQHAATWLLRSSGEKSPAWRLRALPALARTFSLLWLSMWMAKLGGPTQLNRLGEVFFSRPRSAKYPCNDESATSSPTGGWSALTKLLHREHSQTILPVLLHYGDSVSMGASVEIRQPFLDYRLVEWIFGQSDDMKLRDGHTKWIVRKYLEEHGAGFVNKWRKEGFTTPVPTWIRTSQRQIRDEWLCAHDSLVLEALGRAPLERMLKGAAAGNRTASFHVFRLLSLELWRKGLRELPL